MVNEHLLREVIDALRYDPQTPETLVKLADRLESDMHASSVRGGPITFTQADVIAIHQAAQGNYSANSPAWIGLMSVATRINELIRTRT